MKKIALLLSLFGCQLSFAQTANQIQNIEAFSRLYGYVKYFHPSDEAAIVDWNLIAFYGSRKVENCKNSTELQKALIEIFQPIAPTIKIFKSSKGESFSIEELTPPDKTNYNTISWQHLGLGLDNPQKSAYRSIRLNRKEDMSKSQGFSTVTTSIDATKYRNKEFILTASVRLSKGPGSAHLWARVDRDNKKEGFFENMDNHPITSDEWKQYEIKGVIDNDGAQFAFGCFLQNTGKLFVDGFNLKVFEDNEWRTVYTNSFESDESNFSPKSMYSSNTLGYKTFVTEEQAQDGRKSVVIKTELEGSVPERLFGKYCDVGEHSRKEIGAGLTAIVPLALYGDEKSTYPQANPEQLSMLEKQMQAIPSGSVKDLYVRIGDIIIAWNIFQHFYPYFDVAKTDWKAAFRSAIQEAYTNQTEYDFKKTLRKLTAQLKDGHVRVGSPETMAAEGYLLPLQWEWIQDQLVITKVLEDNVPVKVGDIVTTIDHQTSQKYFEHVYSFISAATAGWLQFRAQMNSLEGPENSEVALTISRGAGKSTEVVLKRDMRLNSYWDKTKDNDQHPIKEISNGIYYINIGVASMNQIMDSFSEIQKAKALICDLRGYPNSNHELISYLLQQNDTSKRWMRIPQIIYPDQERIAGYKELGWALKPLQPHLNAKVFFIIDGRAISYAESYLSFIEHYKLATIVGQPSAGTNGNVNPFTLRGGIRISWTGMKVVKHDGSQHHGIGIIPNVYVEKTIEGVKNNQDEFLNKAIELAKKALN